jgi:hypothetical protein
VHPATGFSPFRLSHNYDPGVFPSSIKSKRKTGNWVEESRVRLLEAHKNLFKAQEAAIQTYNGGRCKHFTIVEGSFVLLDREGIVWAPDVKRRATLLAPFLGPFRVMKFDEARLNVTLDLPNHMRCHRVFHVSKLREWIAPNHHFPGRDMTKPLVPAITIDGHDEYEVDSVLDCRIKRGRKEYLIKWVDAAEKENSWEQEAFLTNCGKGKEEFERTLSAANDSRGGVVKVGRT